MEEEEKSSDIEEEEKPIPKEVEDWRPRAREVIEELRHRLAHEATGPPPVCRVRALCANEGSAWPRLAETEFSFQPGTIMTIHRLSEASPGWMYGTWTGRRAVFLQMMWRYWTKYLLDCPCVFGYMSYYK